MARRRSRRSSLSDRSRRNRTRLGIARHDGHECFGGEPLEARTLLSVANLKLAAIAPVEGAFFFGTVATFTDAASNAGSYDVTVDYGDGSAGFGFVQSDPSGAPGLFDVVGFHTFTEEAAPTIGVGVTDLADQPNTGAQVSGPAFVLDAPLTLTSVSPVVATAGTAFTQRLATFIDADPSGLVSDFAATIDWGDGATSAGVIGQAGDFTVAGTHTYTRFSTSENPYKVSVTVVDTDGIPGNIANQSRARDSGVTKANVADAPLTASGTTFHAVEGVPYSGLIAGFTTTNSGAAPADYKATIDWGDGSPTDTNATIFQPGGPGTAFQVFGGHTYIEEATSKPIRVTINSAGGKSAVANSTAAVADAPLAVSGGTIAAIEGAMFSGKVAGLFDTNPGAPPSDFKATVDWGDGSTSSYPAGMPGLITLVGRSTTSSTFAVNASHTYAEEGTFTVKVIVTDVGGAAPVTIALTATVADAPLAVAISQPTVNVTEGAAFTNVPVARFTDADPGGIPADYIATVIWGDGAISTGPVTHAAGDPASTFTVLGSHAYAAEGDYSIVVTVTDTDGLSTIQITRATVACVNMVHVADAPLTLAPSAVNATEGGFFVGTVASFTDADPNGAAPAYTATIDWGDGTSDVCGVTQADPEVALFTVTGFHIYFAEGTYATKITVADTDGGPDGPTRARATAASTAVVAEAPLIPPIPAPPFLSAVEGVVFTGSVVSFVDSNPFETAPVYQATIQWGDGSTSAASTAGGTIVLDGQGIAKVLGSHAYTEEGSFAITVIASETDGLSPSTLTNAMTVADAPLKAAAVTLHPVEGLSFTATVATFTDGDTGGTPADYIATIDWGDGATSKATNITANGSGGFNVNGTHTFTEEGVIVQNPLSGLGGVRVTIMDTDGGPTTAPGRAVATAVGAAIIADAPLVPNPLTFSTWFDASGTRLTITEGQPFTNAIVAKYTDADPGGVLSDYGTPLISWGDGSTGIGTLVHLSGDPSNVFSVLGSHLYTEEGSVPVAVKVSDFGGSVATVNSTAAVADASLAAGPAVITSAVEGSVFGGVLATFTDSDPNADAGDYNVVIDWGDGQTSGAILVLPAGSTAQGPQFSVLGSHIFVEEGDYKVEVIVNDTGGAPAVTVMAAVAVTDAPLTSAAAPPISGTEGYSVGNVQVATFVDADPNGVTADHAAVINWGDGQTSAGNVVFLGSTPQGPQFVVNGSHVYTEEGFFNASVVVTDTDGGTAVGVRVATTSPSTLVTIADAPLTASSPAVPVLSEGVSGGPLTLATFIDADLGGVPTDYVALINWGDGSVGVGKVVATGAGTFAVQGAHAYAEEGRYGVIVSISDTEGVALPVGARSAAAAALAVTVADAPLAAGVPTSLTATEGAALVSAVVGRFSDLDPGGAVGDYAGTIDWGDGSTSAAVFVREGSGFDVVGTHAYAEGGSYNVRAFVTDTDVAPLGSVAYPVAGRSNVSTSGTIAVADAPLTDAGATFALTGVEGNALTNVAVAIFRDADPNGTPSDYAVTIDWGDGFTSLGVVRIGIGYFAVFGTHTFAEEGIDQVKVTVNDTDGTTAVGSSVIMSSTTVTVRDAPLVPLNATITIPALAGASTGAVVVGSFTDLDPGGAIGDYAGTIDWGDGATSSGSFTKLAGSTFNISGSHNYTFPGVYRVTASISDTDGGSATMAPITVSAAKVVAAAPPLVNPTPGGALLGGYNGQLLSNVTAASFSSSSLTGLSGTMFAAIDWGDQQTTAGQVVTQSDGSRLVIGSHTYPNIGTYTVRVALVTPAEGSVAASGTAAIVDAPLTMTGRSVSATEGGPFSAVVANFIDADPAATLAHYKATIDWGDGATSPGTLAVDGVGGFTVSGGHAYAEEGTFPVRVTVLDAGGSSATSAATANVADAPLTASPSLIAVVSTVEGALIAPALAAFTDGDPGALAADYLAVVDWGDGTTSAGTVDRPGGPGTAFMVHGSHLYAEEGAYTALTTVTDVDGGAAGSGRSALAAPAVRVTVADAPLAAGVPTSLTATEGAALVSAVVGRFSDLDPGGAVGDYAGTIDWGDGSTSSAAFVREGTSGTVFDVVGSHAYARWGTYTVRASINDTEGAAVNPAATRSNVTLTAKVNVSDAPLTAAAAPPAAAVEGAAPGSVTVATFTDANPNGVASNYVATIDWGDGQTSVGTIGAAPTAGTFLVQGLHTYAEEGSYQVVAVITDTDNGPAAPGQSQATAPATRMTVLDAALSAVGTASSVLIEGTPSGGITVATFTDADPAGTASDYLITIDWGDGQMTPGVAARTGPGVFTVQGAHSYSEEGRYTVSTLIIDTDGQARSANLRGVALASSTVTVADAPLAAGVPTSLTATEGAALVSAVVGRFSDLDPGAAVGDYAGTIDWGDGSTSSAAFVREGTSGTVFDVVGSHAYARWGTYTVRASVNDTEGAAVNPATGRGNVIISAIVTVADAPLTMTGRSVSATEGGPFSAVVANFIDADPAATLAHYKATIDWGDGATSPGTLAVDGVGGFTVSGGHAYAEEGTFPVRVTVLDAGGSSATSAATANVADAPLTTFGSSSLTAATNRAATFRVATFIDTDSNATANDYQVTINWGDGATSAGVVSATSLGGTSFAVDGSHVYTVSGSSTLTVTIADGGGSGGVVKSDVTTVSKTAGDFNGDGKTDVSVFRPATSEWFVNGASVGAIGPVGMFGAPNLFDVPVPGDYDGVGRTELAVFRPSTSHWYVLSPGGGRDMGAFGAPNLFDVPVPGDYDGVGRTELAVFRPSTSHWYVLSPGGGRDMGAFGAPNLFDVPVPGDYDGVGRTELAVFRPSTSHWYVLSPGGGRDMGAFGAPNLFDVPVPGDYDGVGRTELAVFRPSTSHWYVLSPGGGRDMGAFGAPNLFDVPTAAPVGALKALGLGGGGTMHAASVTSHLTTVRRPPAAKISTTVAPYSALRTSFIRMANGRLRPRRP